MQLQFLGTAGYHPSETRHTSCYFLPESGILLDAGTGMFRLPSRLQTDTLDILLSHAHLDHVVGLTFLLGILYQRPVATVRVWGERAKLDAVRTLLGSELIFPIALPVTWHAIDENKSETASPLSVAGTTVTWRPQEHPGGSVAYRIEWPASHPACRSQVSRPQVSRSPVSRSLVGRSLGDGSSSDNSSGGVSHGKPRSLVYATDTTGATQPSILQWMSGADVLLHECNFHDHQQQWAEKTGHCYLNRVAEISAATQPGRVLLTHINPIDELILQPDDPRFTMPCDIVRDDGTIEF